MRALIDNVKNIVGWKTRRKLVVLCVDDYGNVRLHSQKARESMDRAGLRVHSRFDVYDSLETREDLEMLYETLASVNDTNSHPAVLTAYAVPCNLNFEEIAIQGFHGYISEKVPDTFRKLSELRPSDYSGTWSLWREGIDKGYIIPEFHGREHFNIKVFHEKLMRRDQELLIALKNRSFTSISESGYSTIKPSAAFGFWEQSETESFPHLLTSGLEAFQAVYGRQPSLFTPPAHQFPYFLERTLPSYGLKALDKPFYAKEHLGLGKYKTVFRATRFKSEQRITLLVRNVVFEPTQKIAGDWVKSAVREIEMAFQWNRPAIISSHRVNYCGGISKANRQLGLGKLRELLITIVKRWPEAEFVSAGDLQKLVAGSAP